MMEDLNDACHYIILYNDINELKSVIEDDGEWYENLVGEIDDEENSSDEALKNYLRSAFYFILRRQTYYNVYKGQKPHWFRDVPMKELVVFLANLGLDPIMGVVKLCETMVNSTNPARLTLKRDSSRNGYESKNWNRRRMDAEADRWCEKYVNFVFPAIKERWKHSCVIDHPYDKDWNMEVGDDFVDFMIDAVLNNNSCAFASFIFKDQDKDHDEYNMAETVTNLLDFMKQHEGMK